MRLVTLLFFVATILATCHGSDHGLNFQIFPLRMKTGLGGHYIPEISCKSWRLAVEAHNIIDWETVPQECERYVRNYLLGNQYREDSKRVAQEAYLYAKSLNLNGDGKDIWVFDIDETSLSTVPFYAQYGFGVAPINRTAFLEWMNLGIAPPLPVSLELYRQFLDLGIKIVFITGRPEILTESTAENLKEAGYYTWEKLIMKEYPKYENTTSLTFKSAQRKKLEKEGYRIVGNIGDQWSDILGTNTGDRTFKLPNPMYYIS